MLIKTALTTPNLVIPTGLHVAITSSIKSYKFALALVAEMVVIIDVAYAFPYALSRLR